MKTIPEYHKIQTVFFRDPDTRYRTLLEGQFALSEFEYLANNQWEFTEKVDGTNIRVNISSEGKITFHGRTSRAQIPDPLIAHLQDTFLDAKLPELFPDGATLYGEGYGAGIQKGGRKYRPTQAFILFDVRTRLWWLDRTRLWWLDQSEVTDIAKQLNIPRAPIIGQGTLYDMVTMVREGLPSCLIRAHFAEGIVARTTPGLLNSIGLPIVTKLKHKDFARDQNAKVVEVLG